VTNFRVTFFAETIKISLAKVLKGLTPILTFRVDNENVIKLQCSTNVRSVYKKIINLSVSDDNFRLPLEVRLGSRNTHLGNRPHHSRLYINIPAMSCGSHAVR
jgi:hypothetical protein